ncbi:MAG: tRNA uridine-5-carboxymethylaminomethyl(34) synthesis GTPase MnmE [Lachnospiraceae bacterium]|nr:tRNA uridine-5-carboxymethylaminomethyl(34) synthesis GTPase MnmE [Lachnospiraceae bacterium]MBR4606968.1 tRNA uridine-5-carboxymethylaminomethyl(34) synthesis GTPase MnmE [Lachnospiraceae bacterium]
MEKMNDTIAAIATALSDSGIGIVRISGDQALEIADSILRNKNGKKFVCSAKSHTIHYGFVVDGKEEQKSMKILDEVMVSVFRAPKSYTKEDVVEINCHGGVLVTKKVLELVLHAGARLAEPGEFTKRAFFNGRIDLAEAEAVMDLIHSKNELALKASTAQLRGDLSDKIRSMREEILYEIAFIESALDDPEHISLDGYQDRLKEKCDQLIKEVQRLLDTAENGKMIKEGISTVILGKPNAGKSSLLNMILGQERAIVTDIAGTTRDALEEYVNLQGIHLNVIDTAGIRDTEDVVEKIGVEKAKKYATDADLILYVVDTSVELDENDREILSMIGDKKTIFLLNKSDLEQKVREKDILALLNQRNLPDDQDGFIDSNSDLVESSKERLISMISTSAAFGKGLEELEVEIEKLFFQGDIKQNDQIMITNLRHKEELGNVLSSLLLVKQSLEDGMPEDFYSIDLMQAYASLGNILGEEVGDDLVEEIFSKFCMGK